MNKKLKKSLIPKEIRLTSIFTMLIILLLSFTELTQVVLSSDTSGSFLESLSTTSYTSYIIIVYCSRLLGFIPFLFALGATLNYWNKPTSYYFKRAVIIFAIASAAQLIYGLLSGCIAVSGFEDESGWSFLHLCFSANFLHLVALSYLIIGILRATKLRGILLRIIVIAIAIIFCIVKEQNMMIDSGITILDQIAGFFLPSRGQSEFPLFAWFIVFALGYLFGFILKQTKNKKRFYAISIAIGIISCITICCFSANENQNVISIFTEGLLAYYWIDAIDAIIICLCAAGLIGVFYFIGNVLPENASKKILSQNKVLLSVFITQWILCILYAAFRVLVLQSNVYVNAIDFWLSFIFYVVILVLLVNIYHKFIKSKITRFFDKYWIVVSVIVIAASIFIFIYADTFDEFVPSLINGYNLFDNIR